MTRVAVGILLLAVAGCDPYVERPPPPEHGDIYSFANGCYTMDATEPGSSNTRWLAEYDEGNRFSFCATAQEAASHFTMRASDLGTYVLRDADGRFLVGEDDQFSRDAELDDEVMLLDDSFKSPAEWDLEVSVSDPDRFQLKHHATGKYLTTHGLTDDVNRAAVVAFYPTTGCAAFPEMSLDAEGDVQPRSWPDGDVYGIVETHAHLMTNFGFGGGGIFHGAPFHRLGVEHALPSCERFHGEDGRRDLVGYAFSGLGDVDPTSLISVFVAAMTPGFDHHTDGWPTFTDWPNSWKSSTHQTQYYKWIERAYRGGLRLLVQHATTNEVLCNLIVGLGAQGVRYACNDMVAVERIITETYNLERYIDAQSGGPGKGWFRVVKTPAEARAVINQGKLAVILGIETSNLFDCFLTPREGFPVCDAAKVRADLDHIYERGVRAIFPVHKLDNAFGPGDGDRNVGQIGSFVNSGHYSNMVTDCPGSPSVFDHGNVTFGGINRPRENYLDPAPNDMSMFGVDPIHTIAPFLRDLQAPALEGNYCQKATLTPLGETLIQEMMLRGMIVEVDHLPQRSHQRAYELLAAADYPPAATHGNSNNGMAYRLGGISNLGLGRCGDPNRAGAMGDGLRARIAEIRANGGYPGQGFGFDLNGFAGGPRPRFGENSTCGAVPQSHPITYPFTSYAGDITFPQPHLGERTVDFNTEGMLHLGLLPEYIEDARRDGVTDADLEPLFRSAEGYLRMWEKAEARGAALAAQSRRMASTGSSRDAR